MPKEMSEMEIKHLTNVMKAWQYEIWFGKLERMDVWVDLSTRVIETLQYPLPIMTLTDNECRVIFQLILEGGLPTEEIFVICIVRLCVILSTNT